ncbi:MAG: shikimate dehydrogenase family protein [bacterium]
MKTFGLIGYPLTHSFSQKYFTSKFKEQELFDHEYKNFEIDDINKFPKVIKDNPGLHGLNVTIPYKEKVIPFLDELDETAAEISAVNTIKLLKQGNELKLIGFNTDIYGFEVSLGKLLTPKHEKALILGTGGASKAIKHVLKKKGIFFLSASIEELKENEIRYEDITGELIRESLVIINATPLGTYPAVDSCPAIPYEYLTSDHVLFDLVYNPGETCFLKYGKEKGAKIKNGLEMLHLQAEKAWQTWNF